MRKIGHFFKVSRISLLIWLGVRWCAFSWNTFLVLWSFNEDCKWDFVSVLVTSCIICQRRRRRKRCEKWIRSSLSIWGSLVVKNLECMGNALPFLLVLNTKRQISAWWQDCQRWWRSGRIIFFMRKWCESCKWLLSRRYPQKNRSERNTNSITMSLLLTYDLSAKRTTDTTATLDNNFLYHLLCMTSRSDGVRRGSSHWMKFLERSVSAFILKYAKRWVGGIGHVLLSKNIRDMFRSASCNKSTESRSMNRRFFSLQGVWSHFRFHRKSSCDMKAFEKWWHWRDKSL